MNENTIRAEEEIARAISNTFHTAQVRIVRERRVEVKIRGDLLPPLASNLKYYHQFQHLSLISCVDWLEQREFELVYFFWSYTHKIMVAVKVRVPREAPRFVSIRPLWRQAETYEREIHEMYGIYFEGNPNQTPFLLEDWEGIPPMRRDFDTRKYVEETYSWRPGREQHFVPRLVIAETYHEQLNGWAEQNGGDHQATGDEAKTDD